MKKNILITSLVSLLLAAPMSAALAGLQALDDQSLSNIDGQVSPAPIAYDTGAPKLSLGLELRLNLDKNITTDALTNICNPSAGAGNVSCNIGVAVNNRTSAGGLKDWLVFKNVTGEIIVPNIDITGQLVNVANDGSTRNRAALTLRFDPTQPIQIKKLGFESLAVETDTQLEVNGDGTLNTNNRPGYRKDTIYTDPANTFDFGKFTGFLGLDITANIAIGGTIKVFSCERGPTGCI